MGLTDEIGANIVSTGVIALKTSNPIAWAAFRKSIKCIHVAVGALDEIFDDDKVTAEEINRAMVLAKDYGATRTLQDMLWGVLKHIK